MPKLTYRPPEETREDWDLAWQELEEELVKRDLVEDLNPCRGCTHLCKKCPIAKD